MKANKTVNAMMLPSAYSHSEDFIQAVVRTVVDAIVTIDARGIVQTFNPAAERMFGYDASEVIGYNVSILMPDMIAAQHDDHIRKYLKLGHSELFGRYGEFEAKRKDGSYFPIELGLDKFTLKGEIMFVANIHDISRRKRYEEEIRRHRDHLQELVAEQYQDLVVAKQKAESASIAKSEFLSNMSHELRTPMHAILNYAHMGLKPANMQDADKLEKYFTNIHSAGSRLLGLLNNLLDIAKMESGKMSFYMAAQDFKEVVEHSLIELDSLLVKKSIFVDVQELASSTHLTFDKDKMIQVVINILSNAIKFSPSSSTITVMLEHTLDDGLLCRIMDEGEGIPEDELESVFNKFIQSSKNASTSGGTGLGLAISREIVLAHRGRIWAENRQSKGVAFCIWLPF